MNNKEEFNIRFVQFEKSLGSSSINLSLLSF